MRGEAMTEEREVVVDTAVAEAVRAGLESPDKWLAAWLFYDAEGSRLYERITRVAEYYPTRTEQLIFETHGRAILECSLAASEGGVDEATSVVELGAGTAKKTVVLLELLDELAPGSTYIPVDVSATALAAAKERVHASAAEVQVEPLVMTHRAALEAVARRSGPKIILFIGSSIGNYHDDEAILLLTRIREALGPRGRLVLGTDMKKSPEVLVPAYDDAGGVTAAFNKNVLARINRELGGEFDLSKFRHIALWNAEHSRIEMHLESIEDQEVRVRALERSFSFRAGERIHTESSIKYDLERVDALLGGAGLKREASFEDERGYFAVHVASVVR